MQQLRLTWDNASQRRAEIYALNRLMRQRENARCGVILSRVVVGWVATVMRSGGCMSDFGVEVAAVCWACGLTRHALERRYAEYVAHRRASTASEVGAGKTEQLDAIGRGIAAAWLSGKLYSL